MSDSSEPPTRLLLLPLLYAVVVRLCRFSRDMTFIEMGQTFPPSLAEA